jgi:hypothetical protein
LCASPATAEEDLRAVPLEAGEAAPFTGQLLTPDLAAKLGSKAELCSEKAKLEQEHRQRICMAKVTHIEDINVIRSQALLDKNKILTDALEASQRGQEIPFWDEPGFVWPVALTIGAAVGVGLAFGSAWLMAQVPTS